MSTFITLLFICRINTIHTSPKLSCFDATVFLMTKTQQWFKLLHPVQPSWAATVLTLNQVTLISTGPEERHLKLLDSFFFFFVICVFIIVWYIKPRAETNGFQIAWPPKPPPPPTPHALLSSCWAKLDKFICCQLPLNLRLVLIPAS